MSLQRFIELVAAYGSQLSRFPEAERAAAEALLRTSEPARAALAREVSLDRALSTFVEPAPSAELERRLNEIPVRFPVLRRARWPLRATWAPLVGWAAAAALGLVLGSWANSEGEQPVAEGSSLIDEPVDGPSDDALVELALGSFDSDLEEAP
jgi:hypothetical protein